MRCMMFGHYSYGLRYSTLRSSASLTALSYWVSTASSGFKAQVVLTASVPHSSLVTGHVVSPVIVSATAERSCEPGTEVVSASPQFLTKKNSRGLGAQIDCRVCWEGGRCSLRKPVCTTSCNTTSCNMTTVVNFVVHPAQILKLMHPAHSPKPAEACPLAPRATGSQKLPRRFVAVREQGHRGRSSGFNDDQPRTQGSRTIQAVWSRRPQCTPTVVHRCFARHSLSDLRARDGPHRPSLLMRCVRRRSTDR